MSYIDADGMIDRFGEAEVLHLTDPTDTGTPDADILGRALAAADAQIDDALRALYTVPFAPVPGSITDIAADLARWRLYDDAIPEAVQRRYDDATRRLTAYATGKASLDADRAAANATAAPRAPVVTAPAAAFTDAIAAKMVNHSTTVPQS